MRCPNCKRDIPDNAKFCPYCGYRLEVLFNYTVLDDLKELESLASMLNKNYLPKEWRCGIDKKKKRLIFSPSFKASFLAGLIKRNRAVVISALTLALEEALKRAEEELNVKLQLDGMSAASYFAHIPILYYKVLVKQHKDRGARGS